MSWLLSLSWSSPFIPAILDDEMSIILDLLDLFWSVC
jgi:hypothetical protein